MKKILTLGALAACSFAALAGDHYVQPYTRADGTYVPGHMQSDPNATKADNYSTKGNVNPYTGKSGTVDPYAIKPIEPIKPLKLEPLTLPPLR